MSALMRSEPEYFVAVNQQCALCHLPLYSLRDAPGLDSREFRKTHLHDVCKRAVIVAEILVKSARILADRETRMQKKEISLTIPANDDDKNNNKNIPAFLIFTGMMAATCVLAIAIGHQVTILSQSNQKNKESH